ncbi:ECF transporter S component [Eupransor demetentiae]|uniref:Uncharacterized membrane protein n=1 Tax=Eupransor demetentiae TaxID=3109584 RepID=A0ABP0ENU6_9LACO|nr:Uncharacterized membrane protein [Lactobacillaceae bacterium LMG 33000]
MSRSGRIKEMVVTAIFAAIIILFAFTPLGFVPIGPINATTVHIPVIIGSILLGPKRGALLGLVFGLSSLFHSTVAPTVLGFVFSPFVPVIGTTHGSLWALVIALLPRIILGILPYYLYKVGEKLWHKKGQFFNLFTSALLAAFCHTLMVTGLIDTIFSKQYAQAIGHSAKTINQVVLGIIFTSGVSEAILAGVVTAAITGILMKVLRK